MPKLRCNAGTKIRLQEFGGIVLDVISIEGGRIVLAVHAPQRLIVEREGPQNICVRPATSGDVKNPPAIEPQS